MIVPENALKSMIFTYMAYRPIIRLFYLKYEKLKYWMYQEDVFEELKEDPYFQEYTMEQCQQDLAALVSWGNLLTIQDIVC